MTRSRAAPDFPTCSTSAARPIASSRAPGAICPGSHRAGPRAIVRMRGSGPHWSHGADVPRRQPVAAGPVRHPRAGRPDRRPARERHHQRGRPGVHRGPRHVLPRVGGRRGSADLLIQGRRAGLRAGAGPAHLGVPELRRQRHVPVHRQRARQPARRDAVHRLRAGPPDAAGGRGEHRPRRPAAWRLPRGPVRGPGARRGPSTPTARATSTATSSYDARGSCRASDCPTPVPEWKRSDWAFDALPEHDPARDPGDRDVLGR